MRVFVLLTLLLCSSMLIAKGTKTITVDENSVAQINTALGYSTILQFDARPATAVLGDQDSFKVEYVGNSLTIKPLVSGVKTNLFVFTDYDRFNFRLVTGPQASVDYVVKVTRRSSRPDSSPVPADVEIAPNAVTESFESSPGLTNLVTREVRRSAQCSPCKLTLDSVSYPKEKPWLIVNFSVSALSRREEPIEPGNIQVFEGKRPLSIETLYLSSLKLPSGGEAVHGTAMLKRKNPSRLNGLSLILYTGKKEKGACSEMKITLLKGATKGARGGEKSKN